MRLALSSPVDRIPYHHHPIDDIEPEVQETTAYREAATPSIKIGP